MWWIRGDGSQIRVAEMSTLYIIDSIASITLRGEMGDDINGAYVRTWILTFMAELKRRNGV